LCKNIQKTSDKVSQTNFKQKNIYLTLKSNKICKKIWTYLLTFVGFPVFLIEKMPITVTLFPGTTLSHIYLKWTQNTITYVHHFLVVGSHTYWKALWYASISLKLRNVLDLNIYKYCQLSNTVKLIQKAKNGEILTDAVRFFHFLLQITNRI
jgi:hypothetical protein